MLMADKEKPGLSRVIDKKTAQSHLAFGIRNCSYKDKQLYTTKILDIILGEKVKRVEPVFVTEGGIEIDKQIN